MVFGKLFRRTQPSKEAAVEEEGFRATVEYQGETFVITSFGTSEQEAKERLLARLQPSARMTAWKRL